MIDKLDVEKLANLADLEYRSANSYSVICYYSDILETYTCPTFLPGVGVEAIQTFVINSKRACHLGQVPKQNIGLKCYLMGEFNDSTGKIDLEKDPIYLFTLEAPDESTPINKVEV